MKAILAFLVAFSGSQSFAQEDAITGRMICKVLTSKFVPTSEEHSVSIDIHSEGFSSGTVFNFDFTHDLEHGIEIYLGEPDRTNVLIEEPFPASSFKGISRITNGAEYRTTYSEVSLDKFLINYKGNDQLYLKKCLSDEWEGFFTQTYVSGHHTQVVSLTCSPFVDSINEVLARLKFSN